MNDRMRPSTMTGRGLGRATAVRRLEGLGVVGSWLVAAPLAASTITVPTDQPTIQAAIDAAVSGDLIICQAGTYAEKIDFSGKNVEVRGQGAGTSVIDGSGLGGSVVTVASGEGSGAVIRGFTITGGDGTTVEVQPGQFQLVGGGLYVNGASPTIAECLITMNDAGDGAGMYVWSGSPGVSDCEFTANASTDDGGGALVRDGAPSFVDCVFSGNSSADKGAGLYNAASAPTLTGCVFTNNTATGDGGGMYNLQGSTPTLTDCSFIGNATGFDGGGMHNTGGSDAVVRESRFEGNTSGDDGGGMFNTGSSPTVEATRFTQNTATDDGGGMMNVGGAPVVRNSVFAVNTSGDEGGAMRNEGSTTSLLNCSFGQNDADDAGGGLHNVGGSSVSVTNCILWGDDAFVAPEIFNDGTTTCVVGSSDVEGSGGSGVGWSGSVGTDGGGNIDTSPLFVDRGAGDLRLRAGSPCIDAADGGALPGGMTEDLDTQPRFHDDPGTADTGSLGGNAALDMGAFEFQLETYEDGDLVGEVGSDAFGFALARVGDITGDGVDEFAVGAPIWNGNRGRVYVFSGLDHGLLWKKSGIAAGDRLGFAVAGTGDVDGDGLPEVIVGSPLHDDGGDVDAGRIDVFSGVDGTRLYGRTGKNARDRLGWVVAGGVDVDNDGFDDVIASAPLANANGANSGEVRVYSGPTGQQLRRLKGTAAGDRFGWSLAALGNVDGDAFGDFAVAAPWNDAAGNNAGEVTVYAGGSFSVIFRRRGQSSPDRFGRTIAHAGDVDADGRDDLVVGTPNRRRDGLPNAGRVYVYSGATGVRLFLRTGQAGSRLGVSVASAGDVDCDGRDDIVAGADRFNGPAGNRSGRVEVLSGLDGSVLQSIAGVAPDDRLGRSVSAIRDQGAAAIDLLAGATKGGAGDEGEVVVVPALDCMAAAVWRPTWPAGVLSADLDGDGVVGASDLLAVLAHLGAAAEVDERGVSNGDLNRSGRVDPIDLLIAVDQLGRRTDGDR